MDKDHELFLHDDADRPDDEPIDLSEDPFQQPNEHKHFMTLLGYLEDALEAGGTVPLTNKRMVDPELVREIIANIRGNLPISVQYANELVSERQNILADAENRASRRLQGAEANAASIIRDAEDQADHVVYSAKEQADTIIKNAEIRAQSLIDQHAIKVEAENDANEILNEARAKATDMQLTASAYSENLLLNIERELHSVIDRVRDKRQSLRDEN